MAWSHSRLTVALVSRPWAQLIRLFADTVNPVPINLTYSTANVVKTFKLLEASYEDPEPLMQDVLLVMIRSTQVTFQAEGRPQPWDELAESTERQRFRHAARGGRGGSLAALGGINILRLSGLLWQSVGGGASGEYTTDEGSGTVDKFSATISTSRPAAYNQFPDPRTGRPARVFLRHQEQDVEDIMDMGAQWLVRSGAYAA